MWTWAFLYQAMNILSTVYRKHHDYLEYCSKCFQMHGSNAISWEEHPNWKSAINHTIFKIKIMKSMLLVLWDILLSELRTSTIYYTSEPQTWTNVQEVWCLLSQYPDTSILAAKNMSASFHGVLSTYCKSPIPSQWFLRGISSQYWLLLPHSTTDKLQLSSQPPTFL